MKTIVIPMLLSGLAAGTPAIAQSIGARCLSSRPRAVVEQSAGVEYINGGAGVEARDAIAAMQSRFPLRIALSGKGGEYFVADTLTVGDSNGEVLTVKDAGPLLMVNLPPGRYTIEASYLGRTQTRRCSWGTSLAQ